jgi:hypothetical protein
MSIADKVSHYANAFPQWSPGIVIHMTAAENEAHNDIPFNRYPLVLKHLQF